MTVTPIFDDLAAAWAADRAPAPHRVVSPSRRPSPRPRVAARQGAVVGADAFGRGCLEAGIEEPVATDDEVTRLLEGARREAVALGRHWVDTVHLALAAVRAGGDVGRVFGMRGVGPAVLLAALDGAPADRTAADDPGGDPARPALSSVARTVLHRAGHCAAREGRAVTAAELAAAVARTGRVADLLAGLGVDLDDLADALAATAGPEACPGADPGTHPVPRSDGPTRRPPVPAGVVAPVTVMLPVAAATAPRPRADVPA
ncbi:Clp protease N-terminal domain-containing protein [Actinomycetospora soli]|uniref:Clp protease N-terminal domain-containing protein n=1 Tax=Actinomycetospora soli TaxID=2893887 RepID=UPI001E37A7BA|nr:Clp protease N-terminal domain-containing protein [Actinomycetospora soli]MCD2188632.1 hypothetical protein [Actinomycetospora soli]